jgi:hypothetical protein
VVQRLRRTRGAQGAAFTLEVHQPCQRTTGELLCVTSKVDLLQAQLRALLPAALPSFGGLSAAAEGARDSAAVLLRYVQR